MYSPGVTEFGYPDGRNASEKLARLQTLFEFQTKKNNVKKRRKQILSKMDNSHAMIGTYLRLRQSEIALHRIEGIVGDYFAIHVPFRKF